MSNRIFCSRNCHNRWSKYSRFERDLVVAAGEPALVGLDPAGGVVLLHQVALRLGQAVLVEWDAVNGPLDLMIAVMMMMMIVVQLTPALQTQVGASTPESCS